MIWLFRRLVISLLIPYVWRRWRDARAEARRSRHEQLAPRRPCPPVRSPAESEPTTRA